MSATLLCWAMVSFLICGSVAFMMAAAVMLSAIRERQRDNNRFPAGFRR